MYMMGLMLGQSLMVTGVTVIVLHAKITPYYNVLQEAMISVSVFDAEIPRPSLYTKYYRTL